MNDKILDVEITKVLSDLGPQVYEIDFDGSDVANVGFASFAWLNFGQFQDEKKHFGNVGSNGKILVVIHKCPKFKYKNQNAYSVRVPRKDTLVSCSACNYRFDEAITLPPYPQSDGESANTAERNTGSSVEVNYTTQDPLAILKIRLAKGQISQQEYENLRKIIEA